jgi:hypothetical protein
MKDTDLQKLLGGLEKIEKVFSCSLVEWRHIIQDAATLWKTCPYQVGQMVQLNKTPEVTEEKSWGWLGAKHFLIKGAAARVATREFYDGRFVFGLHFQDESWMDYQGHKQPVSKAGLYCFSESWLEKFVDKQYTEDQ